MSIHIQRDSDDAEVMAAINTTPLVDIMLVLLIIFLITVPVVINAVNLELPEASNQPSITKPENIVISIVADGRYYWALDELDDREELLEKLKEVAVLAPQPEIHIRADKQTRFENVGRVIVDCQRAGIIKVSFITDPEQLAVRL